MRPPTSLTASPRRRSIVRVAGTVLAVALIAAACNSSSSETEQDATAPSDTMATTTTIQASTTAPPTTSSTTTTTAPTTTTLPQTSTTLAPTTTTTTGATTTTMPTPSTTSTTTAPPADNRPPDVSITSPGNLSSHVAAYDPESKTFRAVVSMSATATDPDGDHVKVDWYSSLSGYLGTGPYITASLVTVYDSSQPYITAKATDEHGAVSEDTIQVIVWIPSDT